MNLPDGRFSGVIIDPPWRFRTYSLKGITPKGAEGQYQCLDLEDIKAFPIRDILSPHAYILLWATYPMLPQALDVLQSWGLNYVTGGAWAKQSKTGAKWAFGTGYVLRSASEPFLIAKMGKPSPRSRRQRNLIIEPVREHSRKPEGQYALMEALSAGPFLELFSRGPAREGWTQWGDELGKYKD